MLAQAILLATQPFTTLDKSSALYAAALNATIASIFTIPLLPNRISVPSLTSLSARFPFARLHLLEVTSSLQGATLDDKYNLIANFQVFMPPRYKLLESPALVAYFLLLTALLNAIPAVALNPPPPKPAGASASASAWDSDSDTEAGHGHHRRTHVAVVVSFAPPGSPAPSITPPDARTSKRIRTLPSVEHFSALLTPRALSTTHPALVGLLFALAAVWPADTLARVLAAAPALPRQVYRNHVRGALAPASDFAQLMRAERLRLLPALLLLAELYTHALLTMGDDQFFGRAAGAGAAVDVAPVARNPLTLDELAEWTRQLVHIAFVLYRAGDADAMGKPVGSGVRYTWEGVREVVTRCLLAIHARE